MKHATIPATEQIKNTDVKVIPSVAFPPIYVTPFQTSEREGSDELRASAKPAVYSNVGISTANLKSENKTSNSAITPINKIIKPIIVKVLPAPSITINSTYPTSAIIAATSSQKNLPSCL